MVPFFGMAPAQVVALVAIVLLGALVKSASGFGFALVTSPLLLLLLPPRQVVALVIPLALLVDLLIFWQARRGLRPRLAALLVLPGLAGIPLGNRVLVLMPAGGLRLLIAGLVVLAAVVMLAGVAIPLRREGVAASLAGLLSGVLMGSTGLAGPPLALFMVNQRWDKAQMRATLSLTLVALEVSAILALALSGVVTPHTLGTDLVLAPLVLGVFLGVSRFWALLNTTLYHRLATLVAGMAGLLAIITTLTGLRG